MSKTITGNEIAIEVVWKSTSGGDKSLLGKVKAAKGADLDSITVGLLGQAPKGICWHADTDPFSNGSLIAGKDSKGRKMPFGKQDPISREAHHVRLSDVPGYVDTLVFMVSAYKPGVSFRDVSSVTVHITVDGVEWDPSRVTINASHNTCIMLKAKRSGDKWELSVIDKLVTANSQDELMAKAAQYA
jgi:hypothetical protein